MITKQEIIEALKHCANGEADNQCDGCPGEFGFECRFMHGDKSRFVDVPSVIIDSVIEYLDGRGGTDDYQRGTADAWKLARKIATPGTEGGLPAEDFEKIFGTYMFYEIFNSTYEEARDKIAAYGEIRVGDEVVFGKDKKGVVTFIGLYGGDDRLVRIIDSSGCNYNVVLRICKKTGRHFEAVKELLKLIGDNDV